MGSSRGFASAFNSKAASSATKSRPPVLLRHFASKSEHKHPADGPNDYGYIATDQDSRFEDEKPTLDYAKGMPQSFSVMRHEQIIQLCVEGSYEARREALIRNVMTIDLVEYDVAAAKVDEIRKENRSYMRVEYFPYQAGIGVALGSGVISFPLIFHEKTAKWFNKEFVTTDVPEVQDLETFFEVGSWTWGWMEPAIGQASFVLLVLQFARSQAVKLGIKPYGHAMLSMRSIRLKRKYPQYNAMFLSWFAEGEAMY
jgi:hypothetical protein